MTGSLATLAILTVAPALAQYVGSSACQPCHRDKFEMQSKSGHARSLAIAAEGKPGKWAFGAGEKAITYVSPSGDEHYIESGLSYYASIKAVAITPGHRDASGVKYRTFDPEGSVMRCFRCHSTGPLDIKPSGEIQPFEPGVHCESCHGGGRAHSESGGARDAIANPQRLNAVELNAYCGSCHRKPPEAGEEKDWNNAWNTRHQPTYLAQSACFRKGSLSCITCHDPHRPLVQGASAYNATCSACHPRVSHKTVVGARACVECHMPSVSVTAQLTFTNHWIGVYAKGASLIPVRSAPRYPPLELAPSSPAPPQAPADPATLTPLFVARLERLSTKSPQESARASTDLGLFLRNIGNPTAAEAPLRKALEIDRDAVPERIPADAENLALVLAVIGKQQEAVSLLRMATQGADRGVAARSHAALAMLEPSAAESHYRQALEAEEASSGKDHPRVAMLLNNLALALQERKAIQPAILLLRRALLIQQRALGNDHYETATTLNNLGSALQAAGQLPEAERTERAAIVVFERRLPASKELAAAYTNLADLLWTKGDHASATAMYRRALSVDESIFGSGHPEVAGDLTNLGLLLRESGHLQQGAELLQRALAIYEKTLGPNSPQAADIREALRKSPPNKK